MRKPPVCSHVERGTPAGVARAGYRLRRSRQANPPGSSHPKRLPRQGCESRPLLDVEPPLGCPGGTSRFHGLDVLHCPRYTPAGLTLVSNRSGHVLGGLPRARRAPPHESLGRKAGEKPPRAARPWSIRPIWRCDPTAATLSGFRQIAKPVFSWTRRSHPSRQYQQSFQPRPSGRIIPFVNRTGAQFLRTAWRRERNAAGIQIFESTLRSLLRVLGCVSFRSLEKTHDLYRSSTLRCLQWRQPLSVLRMQVST